MAAERGAMDGEIPKLALIISNHDIVGSPPNKEPDREQTLKIEMALDTFHRQGFETFVAGPGKPESSHHHYVSSSWEDVQRLVRDLKDRSRQGSQLFIYTLGPAEMENETPALCLQDRGESRCIGKDLNNLLDSIPYSQRTILMEHPHAPDWEKQFLKGSATLFMTCARSPGDAGSVFYGTEFWKNNIPDMNSDGHVGWSERYNHLAANVPIEVGCLSNRSQGYSLDQTPPLFSHKEALLARASQRGLTKEERDDFRRQIRDRIRQGHESPAIISAMVNALSRLYLTEVEEKGQKRDLREYRKVITQDVSLLRKDLFHHSVADVQMTAIRAYGVYDQSLISGEERKRDVQVLLQISEDADEEIEVQATAIRVLGESETGKEAFLHSLDIKARRLRGIFEGSNDPSVKIILLEAYSAISDKIPQREVREFLPLLRLEILAGPQSPLFVPAFTFYKIATTRLLDSELIDVTIFINEEISGFKEIRRELGPSVAVGEVLVVDFLYQELLRKRAERLRGLILDMGKNVLVSQEIADFEEIRRESGSSITIGQRLEFLRKSKRSEKLRGLTPGMERDKKVYLRDYGEVFEAMDDEAKKREITASIIGFGDNLRGVRAASSQLHEAQQEKMGPELSAFDAEKLLNALESPDPNVRYWAQHGYENLIDKKGSAIFNASQMKSLRLHLEQSGYAESRTIYRDLYVSLYGSEDDLKVIIEEYRAWKLWNLKELTPALRRLLNQIFGALSPRLEPCIRVSMPSMTEEDAEKEASQLLDLFFDVSTGADEAGRLLSAYRLLVSKFSREAVQKGVDRVRKALTHTDQTVRETAADAYKILVLRLGSNEFHSEMRTLISLLGPSHFYYKQHGAVLALSRLVDHLTIKEKESVKTALVVHFKSDLLIIQQDARRLYDSIERS